MKEFNLDFDMMRREIPNDDEIISFLNSSAKSFYIGETRF